MCTADRLLGMRKSSGERVGEEVIDALASLFSQGEQTLSYKHHVDKIPDLHCFKVVFSDYDMFVVLVQTTDLQSDGRKKSIFSRAGFEMDARVFRDLVATEVM